MVRDPHLAECAAAKRSFKLPLLADDFLAQLRHGVQRSSSGQTPGSTAETPKSIAIARVKRQTWTWTWNALALLRERRASVIAGCEGEPMPKSARTSKTAKKSNPSKRRGSTTSKPKKAAAKAKPKAKKSVAPAKSKRGAARAKPKPTAGRTVATTRVAKPKVTAKPKVVAKPKVAAKPKAPQKAAARASVGSFVWYDLMSTNVDRSLDFYTQLFGWTNTPMEMPGLGTYQRLSTRGIPLGGINRLDPTYGIPSYWVPYVSVSDVDATCDAGKRGFGTVRVAPTDIPQVGRFAVLGDPKGASIALLRMIDEMPPLPSPPPDGHVAWVELMTSDADAVKGFYADLFRWGARAQQMPMGTYHVFSPRGKRPRGHDANASRESAVLCVALYFLTRDVDALVQRAQALGASVLVPADDVPGVGRIAVLGDPTGAMFGLFTPAPR